MCKGELRTSTAPGLTEVELQAALTAFEEIEFLLSPYTWESTEPSFLGKLGLEFVLLRHTKQLKPLDVRKERSLSWRTLEAIEYGQSGSSGTSLRWYLEYAHYLGVSLKHIFTTLLQRKERDPQIRALRVKRFFIEDEVVEQVQEAVGELYTLGRPLTIKAISTATGISPKGLRKYPRVRAFVQEGLREVRHMSHHQHLEYEEELLAKAEQAVRILAETGEPITHQSVSSRMGIPPSTIILYPRVKTFLQQHVDYSLQQRRRTEEREQALLEEVCAAVLDLKARQQPITYTAVSNSIGIHYSTWSVYGQVRAFVDQHLDTVYLNRVKKHQEREEALLPRIEEAVQHLELIGKPVNFQAVGKFLGIGPASLKSYLRVSELIEQRKGNLYFRGRQAGRGEEEVLVEVQEAIRELVKRGQSVTYSSVAREIGMIRSTLSTYPQVKALVDEHLQSYHLYQQQRFALREEELLSQVETAIAELEALGLPVTQRAICEQVGRERSFLRRYPRVKALVEQKASRYHVYQRRSAQPAEEDLLQKVEEAVAELVSRGEAVTQAAVVRHVKISPTVLMHYPRVVAFLEQYGYKKRPQSLARAEEFFSRVLQAIQACRASGQPITKDSLSSMVGVNRATLFHYPAVRALMTQTANEDQQQRKEMRYQKREEELAQQVVNAIQQLRDSGKRVSMRAVGNIVHVSSVGLHYYPKVRALLESAIAAQPPTSKLEQD